MTLRLSIGAAALIGSLCSTAAQTSEPPSFVEWDSDLEVAVSGGYRDNVLRSGMVNESSGFVMTSLDLSLMRFSSSGSYLMFYLFGEDIRYYDAPSVNYEQFISGTIIGGMPVSTRDKLGFESSYIYMHQIYDVSETQVNQQRLLVLGHSLSIHPFWEHAFNTRWETRLEAGAFRQVYEQDLDAYTDADAEVVLVRNYGHRSEWSVAYQYLKRIYDTREQYDETGTSVPGTDLFYDQNEVMGEWRHYWDEKRQWRSLSQLNGMLNRDNGSGYFDYDRIRFREQLRWDNGTWTIKANARFAWYLYKLQTVGTEKRERSYVILDLGVERRMGKHGALFVAGEQEWNRSNDPLDEYDTWMANCGVRCEF